MCRCFASSGCAFQKEKTAPAVMLSLSNPHVSKVETSRQPPRATHEGLSGMAFPQLPRLPERFVGWEMNSPRAGAAIMILSKAVSNARLESVFRLIPIFREGAILEIRHTFVRIGRSIFSVSQQCRSLLQGAKRKLAYTQVYGLRMGNARAALRAKWLSVLRILRVKPTIARFYVGNGSASRRAGRPGSR